MKQCRRLFLLTLLWYPSLRADAPLFQIHGQYRAIAFNTVEDVGSGLVNFTGNPDYTVPDLEYSVTDVFSESQTRIIAAASSQIGGSATFDSFHALAMGQASVSQGFTEDLASAYAEVDLHSSDTIKPLSSSLPDGALVSFLLTGVLEGVL